MIITSLTYIYCYHTNYIIVTIQIIYITHIIIYTCEFAHQHDFFCCTPAGFVLGYPQAILYELEELILNTIICIIIFLPFELYCCYYTNYALEGSRRPEISISRSTSGDVTRLLESKKKEIDQSHSTPPTRVDRLPCKEIDWLIPLVSQQRMRPATNHFGQTSNERH